MGDGPDEPVARQEPEEVDGQIMPDARPPRQGHRRLDVGYQESRYTSALPSPEDLERYQRLLPDAPERLLAAGEREQSHRHMMEERLVTIDERAMPKFYEGQRRGHVISGILGLGYEGLMALAIVMGYPLLGTIGAAAGIGAMVWAVRRDSNGGPPATVPDPDPEASPPAEDTQ